MTDTKAAALIGAAFCICAADGQGGYAEKQSTQRA